jgi:hypothetical protein
MPDAPRRGGEPRPHQGVARPGATDPAGIRTPDQRLRVFVSSTLGELADERAAVARAVASSTSPL